jgi:methionyl-tRNA formyltransferase
MRVGFAGTPEFAVDALAAIVGAGHTIPLCLTQPDRPKGRGLKLEVSPVKVFALRHRIPLAQPGTLKTDDVRAPLLAIPLDVLVVAAYGLLLPPPMLAWPSHGSLNIHASLLPRWRGAAPIQRAIEAGDTTTGITIMQMDAGLDTGDIVATAEAPIGPRETAGTLTRTLAAAGATAIVDALARLAREGGLQHVPQPATGITYAAKIDRDESVIDWSQSPAVIERKLRAFDPTPGAVALLNGGFVKLWAGDARDAPTDALAGTVVAATPTGIDVACGPASPRGTLRITELQPAGGRRMSAAAYLAGRPLQAGARFAPPAA